MKTVILSVVAVLFAYTGMSQDTSGRMQNPTMQNPTMQNNTTSPTYGRHPRIRNNNMKSTNPRNETGTYNSSDSAANGNNARKGRRSGNKSNAYGNRNSVDSTRQ
jgi:hypothetical protein